MEASQTYLAQKIVEYIILPMQILIVSQNSEFSEAQVTQLRTSATCEWHQTDKIDEDKFTQLITPSTDILAFSPVPLDWRLSSQFYNHLQNIKYLCVPTTGYDFLDLQKCQDLGITVTHVPHYATNAVAEYAIFMTLSLLRRLPSQIHNNWEYVFNQDTLGDELAGKTVGIIGLGEIGQRIADLVSGFDAKVIYFSRTPKQSKYPSYSLDDLLRTADIVIPAYAVNESTKNLLSNNQLQLLKPSAYFVSILHADGCDTNLLRDMVKNNKLRGLAYEDPSPQSSNNTSNVFSPAPLAWYTQQSLSRNIATWSNTIESCILGKPKNIVKINIS